jgi:hypothetical protein
MSWLAWLLVGILVFAGFVLITATLIDDDDED